MSTSHLVHKARDDVGHGELALFAGDLAVKNDLEEKVAELFGRTRAAFVPGVAEFPQLFLDLPVEQPTRAA